MEIEVRQENRRVPVTVVRVSGNVDSSTYEAFQAVGEQAVANGARFIVLDLTQVKYISSAGFRAISQIFKLLRGDLTPAEQAALSEGLRQGTYRSPHLKLAGPNARIIESLKLAGFDTFLEIYDSTREAIDSF